MNSPPHLVFLSSSVLLCHSSIFFALLFNLGRYLGGAKGTETPQYPSNVQGEQVSLAPATAIFAGILRVAGRGGIAKVTNIQIFNHFSYLGKTLARPLYIVSRWRSRRAIEASLGFPVEFGLNPVDASSSGGITAEAQEEANLLAEALVLSARETALEEERRSREDNELLQRILELSLLEK